MWCGRKGIDCPDCGVFGECQRSACGLPNIETSTLGTSSSYLVNTISEEFITDIKREAVKEFAEKVKEKAVQEAEVEDYVCYIVDELLREYEK